MYMHCFLLINVHNVFELMTRQVLDNIKKCSKYIEGLSLTNNKQKENHYC